MLVAGRFNPDERMRLVAQALLKIFSGSEQETTATFREDAVTLPLGEILPLLADAYHSRRTWLRDFDDEAVTISADLYEVALAYQHLRRPSA